MFFATSASGIEIESRYSAIDDINEVKSYQSYPRHVRINPTKTNEDSRYEGARVGGNPECPYFFKVNHRKVEPKLKFTDKVKTKFQYMFEDTI
jgi:hypothetical protein